MENGGQNGVKVDQPDDPRRIRSVTINHLLYEIIAKEGSLTAPYNQDGDRVIFQTDYQGTMF